MNRSRMFLVLVAVLSCKFIYKPIHGQSTNSSSTTPAGVAKVSPKEEPKKETWVLVLSILGIIFLLFLSGLVSGLNLAILSLDLTDLQVLSDGGNEDQKKCAKKILPIRHRSNYLLSAFSVAEVAVDSANTVLIESLTNGWLAILIATVLITIFAGIIPQAICHRHALKIGAKTIWLTYIVMIITFPLAYPISLLLKCLIGDEIGHVHDRKYLTSYMKLTNKKNALANVELAAVVGALTLKSKTVGKAMTPIADVFMLPSNAIIDPPTLMKVLESGYSRVPIYEGQKDKVIGLLHIKEMTSVLIYTMTNKNNNLSNTNYMGVKYILDRVPKRDLIYVSDDVSLGKDSIIDQFKKGLHIAFVVQGRTKPLYKKPVIGILTLEDLIEEILQTEIVDESDLVVDNQKKEKRTKIYGQDLINSLKSLKKEADKNNNTSSRTTKKESKTIIK